MRKDILKAKKGGLDTIIAYIVVMLPLLYVLIYMVATIYHFSVQSYMNQVVKEATVMASTYGTITDGHREYIIRKLENVLDEDENKNICTIKYYRKPFINEEGPLEGTVDLKPSEIGLNSTEIKRSDIIGIQVTSTVESILGRVAGFNVFQASNSGSGLLYTSYREEIVRNENPKAQPLQQ